IIPEEDAANLRAHGIAAVFPPGTPISEIVAYIRTYVANRPSL
ncbi:MAG: methylmalonyl-CoA mutase, partial [Deltaproteobacteria bacterium]|nr:methylmalonyl-CoA mutase [Deltaproteobacteria bacterium]